jgi:hypothetical protein
MIHANLSAIKSTPLGYEGTGGHHLSPGPQNKKLSRRIGLNVI